MTSEAPDVKAAAVGATENNLLTTRKTPFWATTVATFFGVGRLHPGPGTWGSAAAILLLWVISRTFQPQWHLAAIVLLAAFAIAIGIPAATQVALGTGSKDPQVIVIDEVAGQLITLIAIPLSWQSLLLGFILFRGFDILKPPPVRSLERLPHGYGIVIDDVGAGIYACLAMHGALMLGLLPR